MEGKVVIFSAPSGSGKTTIVKEMMNRFSFFGFSVSATSRLPRNNECDGKDYYFLTVEQFQKKIKMGEFLEWEEVYAGNYYGTLKSEVTRIWNEGKHVLFDVDVKGGINIKQHYKDKALSLFIQPPSLEVLQQRLRNRGTDKEESIQKRIAKAGFEMGFASQFDVVIINDVLEKALDETERAIIKFIQT